MGTAIFAVLIELDGFYCPVPNLLHCFTRLEKRSVATAIYQELPRNLETILEE